MKGLDPVAELTEVYGDLYSVADWLVDESETDYKLVSVVHGGLYLTKEADPEEAYWIINGEVGEGKTGAWDMESDKFASDFPDEAEIIDVMGGSGRYLVTTSE